MRPVSVPSSKEDIDVLANKVHSVITKSYEAACPMRKSLRKIDNIRWNSEFASIRKEARRAWRNAIKTKQEKDWEAQKLALSYFKKAVRKAKRDSWHSFVESMNSQTPTARLVKIIRRNETVRVSNVIKHNGEFTKSPLETLNYLLDILSPGSQQIKNHATRSKLVDNLFMKPEDTEMIANICSFEWKQLLTNSTIQSTRARRALSCTATERLESTKRILPRHFSNMSETQLCAIGMERRHRYISSQTRKGKLF